jgi:hypothetical protein
LAILILSLSGDQQVEAVEGALRSLGAEYRIYDPTTFPETSRLSYVARSEGISARLRVDGEAACLENVTAVWDRSNGHLHRLKPVKNDLSSYIAAESQSFLDGLPALMPQALWIDDPLKVLVARNKLRQLHAAVQMGFTIPETYVGTDPEIARELIERYDALALKALQRQFIKYELSPLHKLWMLVRDFRPCTQYQRHTRIFTRRFARAEAEPILERLPVAPVIVQEYVRKRLELRVTVVGARVFACAIHSQEGGLEARVDWRREAGTLRHEPYALPEAVAAKCVALLRYFELQFGAIDMIVTPEGEYVFLENNPNGQWLWIQQRTGLPIAEAIAELLVAGRVSG